MKYRLKVLQRRSYGVPWIVEAVTQPPWWMFWAKSEVQQYASNYGILWHKMPHMRRTSWGIENMLEEFVRREEMREKIDGIQG